MNTVKSPLLPGNTTDIRYLTSYPPKGWSPPPLNKDTEASSAKNSLKAIVLSPDYTLWSTVKTIFHIVDAIIGNAISFSLFLPATPFIAFIVARRPKDGYECLKSDEQKSIEASSPKNNPEATTLNPCQKLYKTIKKILYVVYYIIESLVTIPLFIAAIPFLTLAVNIHPEACEKFFNYLAKTPDKPDTSK